LSKKKIKNANEEGKYGKMWCSISDF